MILAHQSDRIDIVDYFRRQSPDVSSDILYAISETQPCLTQTGLDRTIEREAEWLATLIMTKAAELRTPLYSESIPDQEKKSLQRAASVFGWSM
jgi:hypothetical protein